jgi:hypothetical protein
LCSDTPAPRAEDCFIASLVSKTGGVAILPVERAALAPSPHPPRRVRHQQVVRWSSTMPVACMKA